MADLGSSPTAPAEATALLWQGRLQTALAEGGGTLGELEVWAQPLFATVRQVATLLVNGPRASALREDTAREYGGDPAPFAKPTKRQPIECLAAVDRRRLFDIVDRLMADWPTRFVASCDRALLFRSHAIKDMPWVPFAFDSVLRTKLDRTPYSASDGEVAAAAHWLRRTEGLATYKALKALCGESRRAIYDHMDYVRIPLAPSEYAIAAARDGTRVAGPISGVRPAGDGRTPADRILTRSDGVRPQKS